MTRQDPIWPTETYLRQIEQLRLAIGRTVYLVELDPTQVNLGIHLSSTPYVLVGVVDFPCPDPAQGIAPHLVLLSDGRGVNLGRIARITLERPFNPSPADILYQDSEVLQEMLFCERRLSRKLIAERSRQVLGQMLGKGEGALALEAQGEVISR